MGCHARQSRVSGASFCHWQTYVSFSFILKYLIVILLVSVYANSLLISLNTRKELREMRWNNKPDWDPAEPVLTSDDFTVPYSRTYTYGGVTSHGGATSLTMTASLPCTHVLNVNPYHRHRVLRIVRRSRHIYLTLASTSQLTAPAG